MEYDEGICLDDMTFSFWERRKERHEALVQAHKAMHPTHKYEVVCRFWLVGTCRMGSKCWFLHSYIPDKIPLCAYIEAERCAEGANCVFRHYYLPGEQKYRHVADSNRK